MSEFAPAEIRAMPLPDAMPVLGRGRHENQSRGACFMEYTALLAGEPFTDEPLRVDGEPAAILRGANDILRQLKEILLKDLRAFKANKGRFLKNNRDNQNDLLVA